MILSKAGLTVQLPVGWEGQITHLAPVPTLKQPEALRAATPAVAARSETTWPYVHLANFPLPANRGNYGSGAVDNMASLDVFIALIEFGPECVDTALFAPKALPTKLRPSNFHPQAMQRPRPGQGGHQSFLTVEGRAFCLFMVLGSLKLASQVLPQANQILQKVVIDPRGTS